jgi:hypothetical protein
LRGSFSYANASALEERRFVSDGDQRVIFLLLCVNANRYPAAKLNEGKLCIIQILDAVERLQLTNTIAPATFFESAKILIFCA